MFLDYTRDHFAFLILSKATLPNLMIQEITVQKNTKTPSKRKHS